MNAAQNIPTSTNDPAKPIRPKKRYKGLMNYTEAQVYLVDKRLRSKREYDEAYKAGCLDPRLPANPRITYLNDGWEGWTAFLSSGVKNGAGGWGKFLPFEQAKEAIRQLGLKTKTEYAKMFSARNLPTGLPSAPHIIYQADGWTSWPAFLGRA